MQALWISVGVISESEVNLFLFAKFDDLFVPSMLVVKLLSDITSHVDEFLEMLRL